MAPASAEMAESPRLTLSKAPFWYGGWPEKKIAHWKGGLCKFASLSRNPAARADPCEKASTASNGPSKDT